ncbi:MAG: ATP-dependent Clp protease proteolytic subunit [Spirochaetaceae bacterium]|jgi:ATP-dependent protease ClpP protease subunit|nr:ATP-dependent Clp protease proteolytic subunit [Spirochaetaceae bacterium]
MKEILIDGDIGYSWFDDSGITAKGIQKQMEGLADGEDIKITINSPGGSVYEGIAIFNLIRDYAKTHAVSVHINCMAMSIASYIALAARTVNKDAAVHVSENSIVAIHNPYSWASGDYRKFQRLADYLEKLAVIYGAVHASVSGKSEKEIREAMDAETFYVGKEIQDMGFANHFEEISENEDDKNAFEETSALARDKLIINAKIAIDRITAKEREAGAKNAAAYNSDLEKAAALFIPKTPAASIDGPGEKIITVLGGTMKPEELLAKDKELYDAVFALGEKAGIDKERARVNAHLLLGEKAEALAIAAKHIKAGVSIGDETAQAEYYAATLDKARIAARNGDNIGDIYTGGEQGAGGGIEDEEKFKAALEKGYAGRDLGGKPWTE